jgi:hypothetical protein
MRSPDPNIVGVLERERPPDFFCFGKTVAGARWIVGADIMGLPLKVHAECRCAGAGELLGEYPAGLYSTKHGTGIDCSSTGPSENLIGQPLVQMTEVVLGELMSEHKGKLRIGMSDPHDA